MGGPEGLVALAEFHTELLAPQMEWQRAAGHSDHLLTTIHCASRSPSAGLIAEGPHLTLYSLAGLFTRWRLSIPIY